MTKFMEWLTVAIAMFVAWISLLLNRSNFSPKVEWYINYFPIIFIFLFGLYAFTVVTYRVLTFNNCEEAAIELQNEIKEARADLESKGIIFPKSGEKLVEI
ncbi:dolichol-phosphate mannosyltransferase subunit 3 [Copidosoma floridanum]|uniref:dolichol-phosphate mannosyltransferase subunit 3 n=1 Tax=Copidosoma floridanum TaxID=29053 RepID=UPI000C6F9571|nr:dolichol-phosphate mannosyltransferase subunit 3 [Copidosoma floridanum]